MDRDRRRRLRIAEPMEEQSLASPSPLPTELAAAAELNEEVRAAIDRLPEHQREVALLAWGESLGVDEIAQVLDISEASVYTNLHFAQTNRGGDRRR